MARGALAIVAYLVCSLAIPHSPHKRLFPFLLRHSSSADGRFLFPARKNNSETCFLSPSRAHVPPPLSYTVPIPFSFSVRLRVPVVQDCPLVRLALLRSRHPVLHSRTGVGRRPLLYRCPGHEGQLPFGIPHQTGQGDLSAASGEDNHRDEYRHEDDGRLLDNKVGTAGRRRERINYSNQPPVSNILENPRVDAPVREMLRGVFKDFVSATPIVE